MILIGHAWVPFTPLRFVKKAEEIADTPPNSTVLFSLHEEELPLAHHCRENGVPFALIADSYREVIFANALGAAYIVTDRELAERAQKFANEYIIDAKILLYSNDERDLEWAADAGIDGILFEEGIDYGSR